MYLAEAVHTITLMGDIKLYWLIHLKICLTTLCNIPPTLDTRVTSSQFLEPKTCCRGTVEVEETLIIVRADIHYIPDYKYDNT